MRTGRFSSSVEENKVQIVENKSVGGRHISLKKSPLLMRRLNASSEIFSVPGSVKDLRIFALSVGHMTNMKKHLKSITVEEVQNVKKGECCVTLPGSALGSL